jgi:hypothetical protein
LLLNYFKYSDETWCSYKVDLLVLDELKIIFFNVPPKNIKNKTWQHDQVLHLPHGLGQEQYQAIYSIVLALEVRWGKSNILIEKALKW